MRYMLFAGIDCYPKGGFEDFKEDSEDLDYLLIFAIEMKSNSDICDWWHILDTNTMEIIEEN